MLWTSNNLRGCSRKRQEDWVGCQEATVDNMAGLVQGPVLDDLDCFWDCDGTKDCVV